MECKEIAIKRHKSQHLSENIRRNVQKMSGIWQEICIEPRYSRISETRLAEERFLKEVGAGYTFFRSGRKKEERREAGVGFAIKSHFVSKLPGFPKGVNDRLMTLWLPLSGKRHATILTVYAHTITNPDEVKDKFNADLNSVFSATPRTDTQPPRGLQWQSGHRPPNLGRSDWNWKNREVQQQWPPPFKEVLLLLRKCAEHELLITNSVFRLSTRRKTSWMLPCSKNWHLIDYIIVRRKYRQDVRVTKTMSREGLWKIMATFGRQVHLPWHHII